MTETLPAVTEAARSLSPSDYNVLKEQARTIVKSGLAPKAVNTADKVLVIAMKGREIGIPAMQALSHIHVIEGRPTMSAELMAALVQRAGHKLRVIETTHEKCVVEGVRADDPDYPSRLTFDMEDAKRAGVANKGPWKSYPAAMLRARAISALCRYQFADVLGGVSYVPEELGAEVDAEGEVLEAEQVDPGESTQAGVPAEHDGVMAEIVALYGSLPVDARPENWQEIHDYAAESFEKALVVRKRLERMSRETEPEEAEVVESAKPGDAS